MQLTSRGLRVGTALAAATGSLLSQAPRPAIAAEPWKVDASLLVYSEDDDRVADVSFKSLATRVLDDEDTVTLGLQLDTLTGATPTGAVPLNQPQTFTRPSGRGQYEVAAGDQPLDDTFRDSRLQLNGGWTQMLDSGDRFSLGGSFSREYDYMHFGASSGYARDFNQKNTTLSIAGAVSLDRSDPVGGSPVPLSDVIASSLGDDGGQLKGGAEQKSVVDLVFGAVQVIDRRSLAQLNYSVSVANGYLNDPYKFLSVLDSQSGALVDGASADRSLYRFESRPDSRVGHNLFAAYKYHFDSGIADLSFRWHRDDWGIDSQTLEGRYRYQWSDTLSIEPHLRYYRQSAADFYRPLLSADDPLPAFASADYRLGEFDAVTVGLKVSKKLGVGSVFSARVEQYQTRGTDNPVTVDTNLAAIPHYPDTSATIVQINYRFEW